MNRLDDEVKQRNIDRAGGSPEQEKEWQPPCLTVWEVVEDTGGPAPATIKTGSGADSYGMRDVTPSP